MEKKGEKKRIFGTIHIIWKGVLWTQPIVTKRTRLTEKRWKWIASTVSICMILPDIFESKNKMCKYKTSDSRMPIAVMMDVYVMMDQSSRSPRSNMEPED